MGKGSDILKKTAIFFKTSSICLSIVCAILFATMGYAKTKISNNYKVLSGQNLHINTFVPISATYLGNSLAESSCNQDVGKTLDVELKLFGVVPLSHTNVQVVNSSYVSVLGTPFGMKIYTQGVLVIAVSDVDTENGYVNPAALCGLKVGDFIISANGISVFSNEDIAEIIKNSNGDTVELKILRDKQEQFLQLKPAYSKATCCYKAGIWVRDSSAGIGTLTFYSPATNVICGLGHGVCDTDTGMLLSLNYGEIVGSSIASYTKGSAGTVGELNGVLDTNKYGDLKLNSNVGVYGLLSGKVDETNLIQVALRQEITNGPAEILTTIEGTTPQKYKCSVKINNSNNDNRNMIIKITDNDLINQTGGILQGMSGSPILQDGKLIGAITHVLVDDPTTGYGVFAENMLETAQGVANENKLKDAS